MKVEHITNIFSVLMSFSNSHLYVFTWCYILQLTFWSTRCGICEHSWLGLLSHFTSAAGHKRSQGSWRYGPELSNDFVILPLIKQVVWRGNIIENMNRRILMSRKPRYGQKSNVEGFIFQKELNFNWLEQQRGIKGSDLFLSFDSFCIIIS